MSETCVLRCRMQTRPGIHAQYEGHIDVVADPDDEEAVFLAAVRALKRGAFPDYGSSIWRLLSYERASKKGGRS